MYDLIREDCKMKSRAEAGEEWPGSREKEWPKQEVRALRQALKDVPAVMEKNERFRRVSALVGGTHSKKECYDKYKELKAEAKFKQTISRNNSAVAAEASNSCRDHRAPKKNTRATNDDGDVALPVGDEFPQTTAAIGRKDEVESASTAAGSLAASAGNRLLSVRNSMFSSSSSHSTEALGQQQQRQQQQQKQQLSMTSSTFSSVPSEPREDVNSDSGTELGIGCSASRAEKRCESFDQIKTVARSSHVSGSETTLRGRCCGAYESPAERPVGNFRGEGDARDTARGAAPCGEELIMKVEDVGEVELEDFCPEEELPEADQHYAAGVAQARRGGSYGGADRAGRNSQEQSSSARAEIGRDRGKAPERWAVTETEANGARALVFGDPLKRFNDAWSEQGFYFCAVDGLRYGLVQAEGGPCGVLAAVQAFLLEDMVFGNCSGCEWRNPKRSQRERSLASALTSIIWRAGDGNTATLALSEGSATVQRSNHYRPDGYTERLKLYRVGSRRALEGLVLDNLSHYTKKKGVGVILLVYSCIFGRGTEAVREDMDRGFGEAPTLMANHGYASQELVNLVLLGRAHSNVFDGHHVMGEENTGRKVEGREGRPGVAGGESASDRVVLTGVPERGRVGFLTLFEAYNHVEVGDRLKSPVNPIWVVCSESHYSVVFCPDGSLVTSSPSTATAATTTTLGGAGQQPGARIAGGCNTSYTIAYNAKDATHFGSANRGEHEDSTVAGTGKDALRLASRERAVGYEGGVHGTTACEEEDAQEAFNLEYYDGLGRQDEVIRLTVDQRRDARGLTPPPTVDDEADGVLVPPLDLVIRTRWPGATVDWNGTDPIL